MSQPPVEPSGYPHPGNQSYPPYAQWDGRPGYQDGGQPPYPGYSQPSPPSSPRRSDASPSPPPPKRPKAGKIVIFVLVGLLGGVGGGLANYAFKVHADKADETARASSPAAAGHPATTGPRRPRNQDTRQTHFVAPRTLGGRPKSSDADLRALADEMLASMKKAVPNVTGAASAFYGDLAKQDLVFIAGVTVRIADPALEVRQGIADMRSGGLNVTNVKVVDPGPLGGVARCGDADDGNVPIGACVWADRSTLGMILIFNQTGDQARTDFVKIRSEIEQRI